MNLLRDGTVLPHYLGLRAPGDESSGADGDLVTRVGEVQRVVYPDDDDARPEQRFAEYDVMVEYVDGESDAVTHQIYTHCPLWNPLGGLADKFVYTLRGDDSQNRDRSSDAPGLGHGSKVLVLCVQGKRHGAVIIGGVRDEQDAKDKRADGHHLQFVFNGIECSVNDAGELFVSYGGRTTADGARDRNVKDAVVGTKVSFLKNGNLVLSTKDGNQRLVFDNENKQVQLDVRNGKLVVKASDGVQVGDATDAWVKGTTYRREQQQLNQQLQQQCIALATTLQTAKTLPTVITACAAAAQVFQQMAQSIATFEGKADQFLSKKNASD